MDKTRNCISRFHQYFRNEKVYTPKEVKECYVRFLWAFINIGNTEVGKEIISIYSHKGYQIGTSEDYDGARKANELVQSNK